MAAAVGSIVGFSIDILSQTIPQLLNRTCPLAIQINWAEAGGAAVAGAIASLTLGGGLSLAGLYNIGLAKTFLEGMIFGGIGNVLGNQAGALVQSSIESNNHLLSSRNLENAITNYGVGNLDKIILDFGLGFIAGGITTGVSLKTISNVPKSVSVNSYGVWEAKVIQNKLGNPISKPNFQVNTSKLGIFKGFVDPVEWISSLITNGPNHQKEPKR